MAISSQPSANIELRVERIAHLFDALDPFPIPSRDIAKHAEDFIVGWARDLPDQAALRIVLHVPAEEIGTEDARSVQGALARHFTYRAERMTGDLHELFRVGRQSLAIGLGVLVLSIVAARLAFALLGDSALGRILSEGFVIVGWVANWRPIEIFLYDWWPLVQRRRLYRRVSAATVEMRSVG